MKLDFEKFPTIKNLADDVREKALEYAATLGARGPRPTTALGTAVTLAKEWKSGRMPTKPSTVPFLVQPRQGRWVIKRSNEAEPSHTFVKKDDAVRRAQELAKAAGAACFVFGPGGTLIERYEAKMLAKLELVAEPEPAPIVELVAEPEPAPIVELVAEPAFEVLPEPVIEMAERGDQAVVAEDEDVLPTENPSGEDALRVKKLANKWALILGDGRIESFSTQKKAIARAKALAKKLGRPVIVD